MSDISIENYERFRLYFDDYSLLYYQKLSIMTILFWDDAQEDEVEILVYDNSGFHLDESPVKDVKLLTTWLCFFKEQK